MDISISIQSKGFSTLLASHCLTSNSSVLSVDHVLKCIALFNINISSNMASYTYMANLFFEIFSVRSWNSCGSFTFLTYNIMHLHTCNIAFIYQLIVKLRHNETVKTLTRQYLIVPVQISVQCFQFSVYKNPPSAVKIVNYILGILAIIFSIYSWEISPHVVCATSQRLDWLVGHFIWNGNPVLHKVARLDWHL